MTEQKVRRAIESFCEDNRSRQREDLYDHLNKKLDLNLEMRNYDGTSDPARFACDEDWEVNYILRKLKV